MSKQHIIIILLPHAGLFKLRYTELLLIQGLQVIFVRQVSAENRPPPSPTLPQRQ